MTRRRLLVDVDEVLADFQTPIFVIVEELFGKKLTPYDFETWDMFSVFDPDERKAIFERVSQPGFCQQFVPKEGAVEAIAEIRTLVDVTPVTRPFPSQTWAHDRMLWLYDHFGFKEPEIIHTAAKHLVHGDALLDDNPQHVLDWQATHPNGVGMLWHLPNTRNLTEYDHFRVKTWSEVVEKVRAL